MLPIRDVNPTRITPVLTAALIAANVVVFLLIQPQQGIEAERFLFRHAAIACEITTGEPLEVNEINPPGQCSDGPLGSRIVFPEKNVYLPVGVSMFLHGGFAHLLFNMLFLWIFGNNVEEAFGRAGYIAVYGTAGAIATLGFVALNQDATIPLVGASGAIAGVMGAYLVLFPRHLVMTLIFFRIVAIPAMVFLGIWFALQFALVGQESGIAWEAHVAGFLFGVLITLPFRSVLLRRVASPSVVPAT
ncbi:MAG: rhomboid family intramembrane serine protease, partial [Acidimicrobiia bacterium]